MRNRKGLAALAALALLLALALPSALQAAEPQPQGTWSAEGIFSDACQCTVFCPCEFNEKPTFGHCNDAGILNIEHGHWGDQRLDGLRVVVVSQSPHGERLVDAVGRLKFAHIYISQQSSDAQMKALAEIVRRTFGVFANGVSRISADERVERVPMTITIDPLRYRAVIPGILNLDMQALLGGDGKTPIVMGNHPFNPLGLGDPVVARSNVYTYKRDKIDWNYSGRSASFRHFKIGGDIEQPVASGQPAAAIHLAPAAERSGRRIALATPASR